MIASESNSTKINTKILLTNSVITAAMFSETIQRY